MGHRFILHFKIYVALFAMLLSTVITHNSCVMNASVSSVTISSFIDVIRSLYISYIALETSLWKIVKNRKLSPGTIMKQIRFHHLLFILNRFFQNGIEFDMTSDLEAQVYNVIMTINDSIELSKHD